MYDTNCDEVWIQGIKFQEYNNQKQGNQFKEWSPLPKEEIRYNREQILEEDEFWFCNCLLIFRPLAQLNSISRLQKREIQSVFSTNNSHLSKTKHKEISAGENNRT